MRIIKVKNYEELSIMAARFVAGQIYLKPASVLGLATGSTPLGMYKELVRLHKELELDFSQAVSFNLDEYIGLSEQDKNSYHYFMWENFFKHINIKPENVFIPNGNALDIEAECKLYDSLIDKAHGIDMQVLGIGTNAHIGFNEPDIKFEATTHEVELDEETIISNARFFNTVQEVPRFAISMGIKTIMHARKVILLACGANKADAIRKTVRGSVRPDAPASILQLHQDVTLIIDEAAAAKL